MALEDLLDYLNTNNRERYGAELCAGDSLVNADGRILGRFAGLSLDSAFQPLADARSGQRAGHEGLLRAYAGDGRLIAPEDVFRLAGDNNGLAYLDRLCRTVHTLNYLVRAGQGGGDLYLNVHPRFLLASSQHGLVFEAILKRCGLSPEQVVLEILESAVDDTARLVEAVASYRSRGYRIGIDDFGRHHSNFDRLWLLLPDVVKIDRGLMTKAESNPRIESILPKLVDIAHDLGAEVVAEGVETRGQLDIAINAGVDLVQGYFLAHPSADCLVDGNLFTAARSPHSSHLLAAPPVPAVSAIGIDQFELHSAALNAAAHGVFITDRQGVMVWANPAAEALTGYALAELRGQPASLFKSGSHDQAFYRRIWRRVLSGASWHGTMVNRRKNGSLYTSEQTITPVRDGQGNIAHFVTIKQDVSAREREREALRRTHDVLSIRLAEIQSAQAALQEQATRDPLTGLYNRRYMDEALPRELARCGRAGEPACLLLVDVDHFKKLNDSHGHGVGDQVLQRLARLLTEFFRQGDVVVRYGGEEFLIFLPDTVLDAGLLRADACRQAFATEVTAANGAALSVSLSIGVAAFPSHGRELAALIALADSALYAAKRAGRNRVEVASLKAGTVSRRNGMTPLPLLGGEGARRQPVRFKKQARLCREQEGSNACNEVKHIIFN